MPAKFDGKYFEVDLFNVDIKEIKLRNKFHFIASTVVLITTSAIFAFLAIFLISFASDDSPIGENPN